MPFEVSFVHKAKATPGPNFVIRLCARIQDDPVVALPHRRIWFVKCFGIHKEHGLLCITGLLQQCCLGNRIGAGSLCPKKCINPNLFRRTWDLGQEQLEAGPSGYLCELLLHSAWFLNRHKQVSKVFSRDAYALHNVGTRLKAKTSGCRTGLETRSAVLAGALHAATQSDFAHKQDGSRRCEVRVPSQLRVLLWLKRVEALEDFPATDILDSHLLTEFYVVGGEESGDPHLLDANGLTRA
mmetsp:Transcript_43300/g.70104  ORF Transcript_43300/g.70104 Transcript_43300/m.70104 type:complete len:240 (-) Transcript_43300:1004-1723(-)